MGVVRGQQQARVGFGVLLKLRAKRNATGQALSQESWDVSLSLADSLCGSG